MAVAHIFAQELGPMPQLPGSLQEVGRRAELVHEMDGPFMPTTLELPAFLVELATRLRVIAEVSERFITDVPDGLTRLNIALRLWAGCISAAKTIANETMSGQNTPERRGEIMRDIDQVAGTDAIYAAGVEAAPSFKKLRNQGYSFDGVPNGSLVRRYP